jgi:hypothetical protein
MTCPNCGAEINDNRRFCGKCGTELNSATASTAPPAPSAPPASWGAPGTWGTPAAPAAPPSPPPPATAERDPFAPPDLYAPPPSAAPGPPPGYPPPGYPPPGYPPGPYPPGAWPPGYGHPQGSRTNGFAVASLVTALVGWISCGVGSVLAIIFGFIAREQIKRSQGRQQGTGMATAGIVIGFVALAFWLFVFVVSLAASGSNG